MVNFLLSTHNLLLHRSACFTCVLVSVSILYSNLSLASLLDDANCHWQTSTQWKFVWQACHKNDLFPGDHFRGALWCLHHRAPSFLQAAKPHHLLAALDPYLSVQSTTLKWKPPPLDCIHADQFIESKKVLLCLYFCSYSIDLKICLMPLMYVSPLRVITSIYFFFCVQYIFLLLNGTNSILLT